MRPGRTFAPQRGEDVGGVVKAVPSKVLGLGESPADLSFEMSVGHHRFYPESRSGGLPPRRKPSLVGGIATSSLCPERRQRQCVIFHQSAHNLLKGLCKLPRSGSLLAGHVALPSAGLDREDDVPRKRARQLSAPLGLGAAADKARPVERESVVSVDEGGSEAGGEAAAAGNGEDPNTPCGAGSPIANAHNSYVFIFKFK